MVLQIAIWKTGEEIRSSWRLSLGVFCAPSPGNRRVSITVKVDFHSPWEGDSSHGVGSAGCGGNVDPTPRMAWICMAHDAFVCSF